MYKNLVRHGATQMDTELSTPYFSLTLSAHPKRHVDQNSCTFCIIMTIKSDYIAYKVFIMKTNVDERSGEAINMGKRQPDFSLHGLPRWDKSKHIVIVIVVVVVAAAAVVFI